MFCLSNVFIFQLIFFAELKESFAEDFNLFGEAGQAYSIEISIGHPGQKVDLFAIATTTNITANLMHFSHRALNVRYRLISSNYIYVIMFIHQLNVIVDTGSATLAIASYLRPDSDKYFHLKNSTSIYESGQEVSIVIE